MTEIIYDLEEPLEYAHKGEKVAGTFVTLYPPKPKHMKFCVRLKQAFFGATMSIQKNNSSDDSSDSDKTDDATELAATDFVQLFYVSDVDVEKVFEDFKKLIAIEDVAKIDDTESLTKPLIEKLSLSDLEGMLGEYLKNFILAFLSTKPDKAS